MDHLTCEFCNSRIGPILPQDMGESRVMHLCTRCRNYIREGVANERPVTVALQLDGKEIARAVIPHLASTVRNSTGRRNF